MKKIVALIIALAMAVVLLAGCGQTPDGTGGRDTGTSNPSSSQTEDKTPETDGGGTDEGREYPNPVDPSEVPVVYMTTDISADGLMAIYEALGASPEGKIAVKLSTGEPGSNYLRTDLFGDLVQSLDATIVECNTAYGGSRSNEEM